LGGSFADAPFGFGEIFVGVEGAGHLDEADSEFGGVHLYILAEWGRCAWELGSIRKMRWRVAGGGCYVAGAGYRARFHVASRYI
jgi:hypothetical protein